MPVLTNLCTVFYLSLEDTADLHRHKQITEKNEKVGYFEINSSVFNPAK